MRSPRLVEPWVALAAYYAGAVPRRRIAEFCGTVPDSVAVAAFGGQARCSSPEGAPEPVPDLGSALALGADVCRSLSDRAGVLFHLDVDLVTPDPDAAYADPEGTFDTLEPVHDAVLTALGRYGIHPRVLLTGRGYHFVGHIRRDSELFRGLEAVGRPGSALLARYARQGPEAVVRGRIHDGLGRVLEFVAHQVLELHTGALPVTLADAAPVRGRPFICLDLSPYGDPIDARFVRCAFSGHQKSGRPLVVVPRFGPLTPALLDARGDLAAAAALARTVPFMAPPELPLSAARLIDDYRESALGRFHDEFDDGPHLGPRLWPFTYDRVEDEPLPACVRRALALPNPALLQPTHLRTVSLALWRMGWHPRSIAGLVRSRYGRDHGWGDLWQRYDAAARADFYVRVFCGLVAVGREGPADFTCETQKDRGVCTGDPCPYDISTFLPPGEAVPRRVS